MLTSIIIAASTLLVVLHFSRNYFNSSLSNIPGPKLARFSDLWRFIDACTGQHHRTIVKLHREYGPIVRIGPNMISIADPNDIESVLGLKANLDKTDSVKPMMNPYKGVQLPMLISAIDSKRHSQLRRPIAGAYSMTNMLSFEKLIDDNLTKLTQQLRNKYTRPRSQSCLISDWMSFFTFDFILQATFSENFGFLDSGKDVDDMIWTLDLQLSYIGIIDTIPWVDYLLLKNPLLLAVLSTPNKLVDFASEQVQRRATLGHSENAQTQDFLQLFRAAQEEYPETVSDLQLMTYATTNVLAASDTTSAALTAIIHFVLKHPEVLERLKAELREAKIAVPVSYRDASKLKYLDAVIKEVLRIFPPAGIDLERKVGASGLILRTGHRFPPGTLVSVNPWSLHRDPKVFGDNVDIFEPERWLRRAAESDEAFEERSRVMQRTLIAFGSGPRACLGKQIAILQLYKTIPMLLSQFDMTIADPERSLKTWMGLTVKILDFRINITESAEIT